VVGGTKQVLPVHDGPTEDGPSRPKRSRTSRGKAKKKCSNNFTSSKLITLPVQEDTELIDSLSKVCNIVYNSNKRYCTCTFVFNKLEF